MTISTLLFVGRGALGRAYGRAGIAGEAHRWYRVVFRNDVAAPAFPCGLDAIRGHRGGLVSERKVRSQRAVGLAIHE